MTLIEAIVLGLLQGLTEFLPVSSSGHLELGKALLGVQLREDLTFTVVVHGATVLSTIVVFRRELAGLISGSLLLRWNEPAKYVMLLLLSAVPAGIVGLLYKDRIEHLFFGNVPLVGSMLLITALLLFFTRFARGGQRSISWRECLVIGIAQSIAIIPGISRSGATISTGLLLGHRPEEVTRFSFLMVLLPVIGANFMELTKAGQSSEVSAIPLLAGFIAAFFSGLFACKWMISFVKKGKLTGFAIYCALAGAVALIVG